MEEMLVAVSPALIRSGSSSPSKGDGPYGREYRGQSAKVTPVLPSPSQGLRFHFAK